MNYGYAELSGQNLDLKGASEEDRYFIGYAADPVAMSLVP